MLNLLRVTYRALQNLQLDEEPCFDPKKTVVFSVSTCKCRAAFPEPEVCQYWQEGEEEGIVRDIWQSTSLNYRSLQIRDVPANQYKWEF